MVTKRLSSGEAQSDQVKSEIFFEHPWLACGLYVQSSEGRSERGAYLINTIRMLFEGIIAGTIRSKCWGRYFDLGQTGTKRRMSIEGRLAILEIQTAACDQGNGLLRSTSRIRSEIVKKLENRLFHYHRWHA